VQHIPATGRRTEFFCGPLHLTLDAEKPELQGKIAETLLLYDITWSPPYRTVQIDATSASAHLAPARGDFLRCARMLVDQTATGLAASTVSGAHAHGVFSPMGELWRFSVPAALIDAGNLEELEDLLSLVLTTGWRRGHWTPIHAAAVVKGARCTIICAPTGGGKTTLTAALVRRGWQVLGDDKLLLRHHGREPYVAALLHTFNLHPKTREWFPEVGDLEVLPRYSAWTEKRKVNVTSIWTHAPAHGARPTMLVSLQRDQAFSGVVISPLDLGARLDTLLRQTVIPVEAATARAIITDVANAASVMGGIAVRIGTDAYHDANALAQLEAALEGVA